MAKIRFEDVSITAKAIELEGISDPSSFIKGLGLEGAKVREPIEDTIPEKAEVKDSPIENQLEEMVDNLKKASPEFEEKYIEEEAPAVPNDFFSVEDFASAKRLSNIISIFAEKGVTADADIIAGCKSLKEKGQPILKMVGDIEGRIPIVIEKWRKSHA